MITLIDRQLMGNFFRAYGICLTSMLALYIVVDLFTNLDDFTGKGRGIKQVIFDIGTFYSYRVLQIFDHLCEAILLLAAMFTVTWMQRCNEQVPLLAAGSPLAALSPRCCSALLPCSAFRSSIRRYLFPPWPTNWFAKRMILMVWAQWWFVAVMSLMASISRGKKPVAPTTK